MSELTLKRKSYALGFKSRKPVKKPVINERIAKLRLEFALKYRANTFEDWKKVMFGDEWKVNRIGNDSKSFLVKRTD